MAEREAKDICIERGMTESEADEFVAGMKRGMEARARGERIPWNEVKERLGL